MHSLSIDTIVEPVIARLVRYWFRLRGDRDMPSRQDIDATAVPDVLPYIWLADFDRARRRFRYRLAGERVREAYTESVSGRFLDQITRENAIGRVSGYFEKAVDLPCIVHVHGMIFSELDRPARGERILLPLSSAGGAADGLLGATVNYWDNMCDDGSLRIPVQYRVYHPIDGSPAYTEESRNT